MNDNPPKAALSDIRENDNADDYWASFEKIWTQLLTYRYLGRRNPVLDKGVSETIMPLRHDSRDTNGYLMAAPLAIAAAECGGMQDDQYIPNPLSSSLQIIDNAEGVKTLKVIPETVKLGRSMGFSRSLLVDYDYPSRVIAVSSGTAISLGSPPPGYRKVDNPPIEVIDSVDMPPLHQVFGARRKSCAEWELPKLDLSTASPDTALHLGPQHIVLESAAADLVESAASDLVESAVADLAADHSRSSQYRIVHWEVTFVARGKVGPFRTQASVYVAPAAKEGQSLVIDLLLCDVGNNNRAITMAKAVYQSV